MKSTGVRRKVENPRRQRSSRVFTASDGAPELLHSAFPFTAVIWGYTASLI